METTPGTCEAVQSLFLLACPGSVPVRFGVWVRILASVRVRIWFATGSCPGSCPVRVCFVSGFVSGSCLVSGWVRFVFVSGACLVRIRFVSGSGSRLVRVWVRTWFVSRSCRFGSDLVRATNEI